MVKNTKEILTVLILIFLVTVSAQAHAQIEAVGHKGSTETQGGFKRDSIYIFCASGPADNRLGTLIARSPFTGISEFNWEKYDTLSHSFVDISDGVKTDSVTSRQTRLNDGLYRVTISSGSQVAEPFQAWVLHNWITAKAEIPDSSSNCLQFKIEASYEYAPLTYFDTDTRERKSARNPNISFRIRWYKGTDIISSVISPIILDPPPSDSPVKYSLTITDMQFGCTGTTTVDYLSKTTQALFTYDPANGEAVLKVTFTNSSINYDSAYWYFSKDLIKLKYEIEANPDQKIDSLDFILTDRSPVYEYQWSGEYRVNLITAKVNPSTGNCYDTLYMKPGEFIEVDTSDIQIPNVFTPNDDGSNDNLIVFTHSLKSMSLHIYNRWGGLVHRWSYSNIRESDYTHEHSVWDGKVMGGGPAPTGVYFVVVQSVGREGKRKKKEGFVHLFR